MARLAVIGGGLAGAALVLALRREGQDQVTWYTAQDGRRNDAGGDFLQLPPNATRVLLALGLRQQLEQLGMQPQALLHRSAGNSFVWADLPLGGFVVDRFKAPFLCCRADALFELLEAQCGTLPGEQLSQRPVAVTASGAVQEADGTGRSYDLVVLATGADAELQLALQEDDVPGEPSVMYHARLPLVPLPAALAQPVLTRWSHPQFNLWTLPDNARGQLQLQLRPAAGGPPLGTGTTPNGATAAGAVLPSGAALPAWTADAPWQALQQLKTEVPERLCRDRLVLCGNAAHRLPLCTPLGPALALEDAWVLSRLIEQNDSELEAVGPEFERFRAPRSRQLRQRTAQERANWDAAAGPRRALYRLRTLLTHRFLPEFAYQELDWLYGYDSVRGFR